MRNHCFVAQIPAWRVTIPALTLCAFSLTGCSDTPHDRIDTAAPSKTATLPTTGKIASDKPEIKPVESSIPPPTEAELGMAVYPNAKTYSGVGGNTVKPSMDSSLATALLETPDSLDKVLDFYKAHIQVTDARGNATPATPREEKENGKRRALLTGNDSQGNMQVANLREEDGKTIIELMRTSVKTMPSSVSGGK